jgi:acyl-CoA synthetase (AMP-forming)/AMP-acid ligase II
VATPDGFWPLLERRVAETPDALFSVEETDENERRLTFAEYRDAALACAAGLAERGVEADSAVSWMLPTWTDALVLVAALARLGARQNPILPIYRAREVGFITEQSNAELLVVPRVFRGFDYEAMAQEVAGERDDLQVMALDPDGSLPQGDVSALPASPAPTTPEDAPVRWLFYTSGTTADPKGALHSDHSLLSAAVGMCDVLSLQPDDRVALVFPLTHIGGIGWLLASLVSGCALIVIPVFEPKASIQVLAKHGVTQATAGTAFHQAYLEAQRAQPGTPLFPNVRAFPGGGAPKPPQLHADVRDEIGGVGIVSGYGMTECPIVSMNRVSDPTEKLAQTEGRANPPTMQIKLEGGEIRVRGPQLFRGYLDPKLNDAAFDEDGFFRTGDLGEIDPEGFVVITGRLKDVIIRKGENISAKEIEDLLHLHPKIAEAAAVGLPDPSSGERCCAVVGCRDPADPIAFDEMVAFLKTRELMTQKIPEQLEIVDVLPRNPTGKVLKTELRERFGS